MTIDFGRNSQARLRGCCCFRSLPTDALTLDGRDRPSSECRYCKVVYGEQVVIYMISKGFSRESTLFTPPRTSLSIVESDRNIMFAVNRPISVTSFGR